MKTEFIPGKLYKSEITGVVILCEENNINSSRCDYFSGTVVKAPEKLDGITEYSLGSSSFNWYKGYFEPYEEPINEPELKVLL